MRIDYLSPDILLFRGDSLGALATAFVDGQRVLLVDMLASVYDAIEMRDYLERDRGFKVEALLLPWQGAAREAGARVFGAARVLTAPEAGASLAWGRHRLDFLAVAGGPAIEVAASGLLLVGERVMGAVALLGEAGPDLADKALAQLQQCGAARIVPAHLGVQDGAALAHARTYLQALREQVSRVRSQHDGGALQAAIAAIALDACLPGGVHAGALERHWHTENLKRIAHAGWFPAPLSAAQRRAPSPRLAFFRRGSVMAMLTCMLGRLGRSGV